MTLLADLEAQSRRVAAWRLRRQRADAERAAERLVPAADEAIRAWHELRRVALLPATFAPVGAAALAAVRDELAAILRDWAALDPATAREADLHPLRDRLETVVRDARRVVASLERVIGEQVGAQRAAVADARFLAATLGLDPAPLEPLWAEVERHLEAVEAVRDRRRPEPLPGWAATQARFEAGAGPAACLRRAELPPATATLAAQLLAGSQPRLEEIGRDALLGLLASPALARLCRLTLPRSPAPER